MDTFKRIDISAAALHVLAMTLMLMDHLWATLFPSLDWLTCAGRIAFPIFAFMIVKDIFIHITLKSMCRDYFYLLYFLKFHLI